MAVESWRSKEALGIRKRPHASAQPTSAAGSFRIELSSGPSWHTSCLGLYRNLRVPKPWGRSEPDKGLWCIYLNRNYSNIGYMTTILGVHSVPKEYGTPGDISLRCHQPSPSIAPRQPRQLNLSRIPQPLLVFAPPPDGVEANPNRKKKNGNQEPRKRVTQGTWWLCRRCRRG